MFTRSLKTTLELTQNSILWKTRNKTNQKDILPFVSTYNPNTTNLFLKLQKKRPTQKNVVKQGGQRPLKPLKTLKKNPEMVDTPKKVPEIS